MNRFSIDNGYKGFGNKNYYVYFKFRYGWEEAKIMGKAS